MKCHQTMTFHSLPQGISEWDESLILPNFNMESCCFSLSWVKLRSAYSSWSLTVQLRPCKIQEILILRECRGWVKVLPRVQGLDIQTWLEKSHSICLHRSWIASLSTRMVWNFMGSVWLGKAALGMTMDSLNRCSNPYGGFRYFIKMGPEFTVAWKSLQSEAKLKQVGNPKEQSTERSLEFLATPKVSIGSPFARSWALMESL